MSETRTYFAISILSSRTFWFNVANLLVAVLSLTEVAVLIPPRFMSLQAALVAIANMYLRTVTVRPVAFIAPGTSTPVSVPKINPPDPSAITD